MRGGVIGIDGYGPANKRRLFVIAGLRLQYPQQMQGIKVIGRLRQISRYKGSASASAPR
jgi:hypothetical protein